MEDFETRLGNLLAFYILASDNESKMSIPHIEYLQEKFDRYLNIPNSDKLLIDNFCHIIYDRDGGITFDGLISLYESVFGINSFEKISIEKNYKKGLHQNLYDKVFIPSMKTIKTSRKYKIKQILNME
jgi:hypothetical protein